MYIILLDTRLQKKNVQIEDIERTLILGLTMFTKIRFPTFNSTLRLLKKRVNRLIFVNFNYRSNLRDENNFRNRKYKKNPLIYQTYVLGTFVSISYIYVYVSCLHISYHTIRV